MVRSSPAAEGHEKPSTDDHGFCDCGVVSVAGGHILELFVEEASAGELKEVQIDGRTYLARVIRIDDQRTIVAIIASGPDVSDLDDAELRERFGLTPREAGVARFLARRRSNAEIADELHVTEHTARRHTERVLSKLGIRSRRDVAGRLAKGSGGVTDVHPTPIKAATRDEAGVARMKHAGPSGLPTCPTPVARRVPGPIAATPVHARVRQVTMAPMNVRWTVGTGEDSTD